MRTMKKYFISVLVAMILLGIVGFFLYQYRNRQNPYFFKRGETKVEYEGFFYPLSCREIEQNVNLNIREVKAFEEGILYELELDELDVTNPLDRIGMGAKYLGYFYVTKDAIYLVEQGRREQYSDELREEIIKFVESGTGFFEECMIVCNEDGTENIADENGWHEFVEVDGKRRIFHMYNDYRGGTKEYQTIIWEKGKGIVYYKNGAGGRLMHVELKTESSEDLNLRKILKKMCEGNRYEYYDELCMANLEKSVW